MSTAVPDTRPAGAQHCPIAGKWSVTRAQAKKEAKRVERKTGAKINVWKCECGGWHIGKRKPRPRPY